MPGCRPGKGEPTTRRRAVCRWRTRRQTARWREARQSHALLRAQRATMDTRRTHVSRKQQQKVMPPLAGLATYEQAARVGYSVEENVTRLCRYNYVKTRLVEISAAFMNPAPEWEVKTALSLHLYLDAEHSQAIRQRITELRNPPPRLDESPDARLTALMEEALRAQNTLELLVG